MSSSHFCAAERQFRTPLDYGGKRTPTAQWTVTGAGAAILAPAGGPPYVRAVTFGRVRDYNVTDINNMGCLLYTSEIYSDVESDPSVECIMRGVKTFTATASGIGLKMCIRDSPRAEGSRR